MQFETREINGTEHVVIPVVIPRKLILAVKTGEGKPKTLIPLHPEKLHETWLTACMSHGLRRKVNDDCSEKGRAPEVKADMMAKYVANMESGSEFSGRINTGTGRAVDPITDHMLKAAKADLIRMFKKLGLGNKIAEYVEHEAAAKYFKEGGVWIDDVVLAWAEKRDESGKTTYRADAEKANDEELDLSDLEVD